MSEKQVTVSVLGCLPFLLGLIVLGGLGFCGKECQGQVTAGVHTLREAVR